MLNINTINKEFIEVLANDTSANGHNILLMHTKISGVHLITTITYEVLNSKYKSTFNSNLSEAIKEYNRFYENIT